jgi:predicted DNA-binding transcriptional regulator YafY
MVKTSVVAGVERRVLPGTLLELTCQNDSGAVSRRKVRMVKRMHGRNGFFCLRGWCFLRGEERTFRANRILDWHVGEAAVEVRATGKPKSAP